MSAFFLRGVLLVAMGSMVLGQPGRPMLFGRSPFAPLPAPNEPCPSVIVAPSSDASLSLGDFPLSTKRPPVVDGDTLRVDGLDKSLRLLGLDAEETFKEAGRRRLAESNWGEYLKTMNAGANPLRPPKYGTSLGEAASRFAQQFFRDIRQVRLERDDPTRTRGYYGRHLVHVLVSKNGRWIHYNVELVRQGLSPYFVKYGACKRYHQAFEQAQLEARRAGRGIWSDPPHWGCYPDYPARLAWWEERKKDIEYLDTLIAAHPEIIVLGDDTAWERLLSLEGKPATIAGSPIKLERRGDVGVHYVSHRRGQDFAIAGPYEAVENLGLTAREGEMLLITGVVSLHRTRPQFLVDTVKIQPVRQKEATPPSDR